MKSLLIALIAILLCTVEAAAQKISAAAVADQHYAAQTANYKLMMVGLAVAYGIYLMLYVKRKREVNRFMGKI